MAQIIKKYNTQYGEVVFKSMEEELTFKRYGYYLLANDYASNAVVMKRPYIELITKHYPTYAEKLAEAYGKSKLQTHKLRDQLKLLRLFIVILFFGLAITDAIVTKYLITALNTNPLLVGFGCFAGVVVGYLILLVICGRIIFNNNVKNLNINLKEIIEEHNRNNVEETKSRIADTIKIIEEDDLILNKKTQIESLTKSLNRTTEML